MTIKEVTYYEAWCEGDALNVAHQIQMGEYTAFVDHGQTADEVTNGDGLVCADGRVFCYEHVPKEVCPDTSDNVHVFDDEGVCECGYERPTDG